MRPPSYNDDDDTLPPDAPETPAERARASAFASLVDGLVADEPPPPALGADDRALLETATAVRAGAGRSFALAPGRASSLIDDALARATGAPGAGGAFAEAPVSSPRWRRAAPWAVATVAAAAAQLLALRGPVVEPGATPAPQAELPASVQSRPADGLVGIIPRERADAASARLDAIYADRMAGYRSLTLGGSQ